jgi:hypothetical protein
MPHSSTGYQPVFENYRQGLVARATKYFRIPGIFASARAARRSAQKRSAPLRLASWGQLGSFCTIG